MNSLVVRREAWTRMGEASAERLLPSGADSWNFLTSALTEGGESGDDLRLTLGVVGASGK